MSEVRKHPTEQQAHELLLEGAGFESIEHQLDAVDALDNARRDGANSALLVMATGLGKTIVSAADASNYVSENPGSRGLFLAHRREILEQAEEAYSALLPEGYSTGFFHGFEKDFDDPDVLFATFQTLSGWTDFIDESHYDYIVIDEAHHSKAPTFESVIDHFKPRFLLGMTATPKRGDGEDILDIFDTVVYDKSLGEALSERLLAKPDYRIIVDGLADKILEAELSHESHVRLGKDVLLPRRDEEIARLIEEAIEAKGITNPRVFLFGSSIEHVEQIASIMNGGSIKSIALHSHTEPEKRATTVDEFRTGDLNAVATVNIFNEGVDIPEANVVVFLRSTTSETVFLQQLGRGLRAIGEKEEVLILDFANNLERIRMIDSLIKDIYAGSNLLTDQYGGRDIDNGHADIEQMIEELRSMGIADFSFSETALSVAQIIRLLDTRKAEYKNWNLEQSVRYYQSLSDRLGRPATVQEIEEIARERSGPSVYILTRCIEGGIPELRKLSGYDEVFVPERGEVTKEFAVDLYRSLSVSLGRVATKRDIIDYTSNHDVASWSTIRQKTGLNLTQLRILAGFEVDENQDWSEWTEQDSIRAYFDLSAELGRPAKTSDIESAFREGKMPSRWLLTKGFGNKLENLRQAVIQTVS